MLPARMSAATPYNTREVDSHTSTTTPASSPHTACCLVSQGRLLVLVVLCAAAAVLWLLPPLLTVLVSALSALDASAGSAAVFFVVLLLLCSPFTLGYGVVVLTAGVVFGWWAFPLVYCASVLGGSVWFVLFRWLSRGCGCNVASLLFSVCPAYSLYLRAFTSALESYPIRSAALLQLSFLPFGALCALLSSTELPLSRFIVACLLSRVKLLAYISLAQSAGTVHTLWTRDAAAAPTRWQDALTLALSVLCSVVALSTVSILASRQLKRMREDSAAATSYPALADSLVESAMDDEYNRLLSPRGSRSSDTARLDIRDVDDDEGAARHFGASQQLPQLHDGATQQPTLSPQLEALSSLSEAARARSTARPVLPPPAVAVAPSRLCRRQCPLCRCAPHLLVVYALILRLFSFVAVVVRLVVDLHITLLVAPQTVGCGQHQRDQTTAQAGTHCLLSLLVAPQLVSLSHSCHSAQPRPQPHPLTLAFALAATEAVSHTTCQWQMNHTTAANSRTHSSGLSVS